MGRLYIVSTPIGNRQDISLRALEVLKKVKTILCEDTRKTGLLLKFYEESLKTNFEAKLISFFEQNEEQRMAEVFEKLAAGDDVALVSNAGTPLLSDPGYKLTRECIKSGVEVIPVPGASALLAGLVVSGLPMDKWIFLGFLPKKAGKKKALLEKVLDLEMTLVFYESPFRIIKTMEMIKTMDSQAKVSVARELTKKFEEILRGSAEETVEKLKNRKIKGELVVMVSRQ